MEIFKTVLLAVVQGLTEFLPVSSSGHLVIFGRLLKVERPGLILEVALHLGTVLAVVAVYWRDLWAIVRDFLLLLVRRDWRGNVNGRFAVAIVVGSVPTAAIGVGFKHIIEGMFENLMVVGVALVVTAVVLWTTRYSKAKSAQAGEVGLLRALLIGVAQGLAIMPGISRSGATISSGLLLGIERETAARFSFLMSIPAILGAALLEATDAFGKQIHWTPVLIGIVVSFAVGYLALKFLLWFVKKGRMHVFAYYCLPVGLLALLCALL